MILVQILLGSITRLTGSGLSITEWKPLIGALPPLNHAAWTRSFGEYQKIAQFKKLNSHFTLSDYQRLFFWEWIHREWARLMGLVFLIPFTIFLWQRKFSRELVWPLAGVFLLGGLQGLAGWLMVQSGLNETDVMVSHIRLAVHFSLAVLLLLYLFRLYVSLGKKRSPGYVIGRLRNFTALILYILGLQLVYGAFMAGTHAALFAPTWPDINGAVLSASPAVSGGYLYRITYDPLLIQFVHRGLAYLLVVLILVWWLYARRLPAATPPRGLERYPPLFVLIQVGLGIAALRFAGAPQYNWIAVAHQLNGILLLLSLYFFYLRTTSRGA